jgi:hypothetical protein
MVARRRRVLAQPSDKQLPFFERPTREEEADSVVVVVGLAEEVVVVVAVVVVVLGVGVAFKVDEEVVSVEEVVVVSVAPLQDNTEHLGSMVLVNEHGILPSYCICSLVCRYSLRYMH